MNKPSLSTANKPLISVIIPVYNAAIYLPSCIESLLAQTYPNLEILLVNDGSTDNSAAICENFARQDKRVKVLHKPNGGVSSARNLGLDNARGEYIGFVDADDSVHPKMYEILLKNLQEQRADLVACQWENISLGEKIPFSTLPCDKKQLLQETEDILCALGDPEYAPLHGVIWNKLFTRQLINTVRFDVTIHRAEDTQFLISVLQNAHQAVVLQNRLYVYYKIPMSVMHRHKLSDWLNECSVGNFFVATCQRKHYDRALEVAHRFLYCRTVMVVLILTFADMQNKHNILLNEKIRHLVQHKKYVSFLTRKQQWVCLGLIYCPKWTLFIVRIPWIAHFFNKRYHFDQYDLSC